MSSGTCKLCGHSYEQHLHTYHKGCPERSSSTIPEPRRGSETLGIERARLSRLSQSTEMGEQYEVEQRRIIEIGARFALLVEKNAILGFNASLGTYLRTQIESL